MLHAAATNHKPQTHTVSVVSISPCCCLLLSLSVCCLAGGQAGGWLSRLAALALVSPSSLSREPWAVGRLAAGSSTTASRGALFPSSLAVPLCMLAVCSRWAWLSVGLLLLRALVCVH